MQKTESLLYFKLALCLHSKPDQWPRSLSFNSEIIWQFHSCWVAISASRFYKVVVKSSLQVQSHIDTLIYLTLLNAIQQWKGGLTKIVELQVYIIKSFNKGVSK